jgi:hypothetical protein
MSYMVRRVSPDDLDARYIDQRWTVHPEGRPCDTRAFALTKWGARRIARRWARQADAARRSYPA